MGRVRTTILEQKKYKDKSVTIVSPVIPSPGSSENTESPWYELYCKLKEINAFDYPDSSIVSSNGFVDTVYKTFDSLWNITENDDASSLFFAYLDRLSEDRKEFPEKLKQLLASQNIGKDNDKLSDKTKWLQMHINSLNVSKYALEEIFFPSTIELKLQKIKSKHS